eukprot:15309859-Alexandrium_andersonii.AAC.1
MLSSKRLAYATPRRHFRKAMQSRAPWHLFIRRCSGETQHTMPLAKAPPAVVRASPWEVPDFTTLCSPNPLPSRTPP